MHSSVFFQLFANCLPVKGASRAIICDLQKGCYIFISNKEADLCKEAEHHTLERLLEKWSPEFQPEEILTLFDSLIAADLGHYCDEPHRFPKLSEEFTLPYAIQDCIIEVSELTCGYMTAILDSLTLLGCQALELRCYDAVQVESVARIMAYTERTRIRTVDIYLKYSEPHSHTDLERLVEMYPVIETLVVHAAPLEDYFQRGLSSIRYLTRHIDSSACCGLVSADHFVVNQPFYLLAKKKNSCLYKKISVRGDGSIANCPSLEKSFGNIRDVCLEQVASKKAFQTLWEVTKDQIGICQDCEFRYICSDCRAFVGKTDKPLKCNYNPYTTRYE